jgi:uncharacterized repeat protein (TIGR03803 family)
MKTKLLPLIVIAVITWSKCLAGADGTQLWTSMGTGGSPSNSGVIFSINADGSQGAAAFAFNGTDGSNPSGNMVQTSGNLIYGTTTSGGLYNDGVLFCFNTATHLYQDLHNFNGTDGSYPRDLLLGADGNIYGTTMMGGSHTSSTATNGCGVMYSYNPLTKDFILIRDFAGNDGENPQGLMQAKDGKIYGMTRQGGTGYGTIFSYAFTDSNFTSLYSFHNTDGALPSDCGLIQATDGNLYGMTTWGGIYNQGVIFRFAPGKNAYSKLYDFPGGSGIFGGTGAYPGGTLMQASYGNLYGLTTYGGQYLDGVIFTYNLTSSSYSSLFNFNGENGANPVGGLIQISNGLLYGTTSYGGTNGTGVIFNYNYYSSSYNVVSDCNTNTGGGTPMSNLIPLSTVSAVAPIPAHEISLYPNPATDQLILQTGDSKPEQVVIRNMSGQQVLEQSYIERVDISGLAAGVYFIQVKNNTAYTWTKFIKL